MPLRSDIATPEGKRRYVRRLRREHPGDVISIVIPEYVVERWWENLLHNQTALRLKLRLFFRPNTIVADVPYHPPQG